MDFVQRLATVLLLMLAQSLLGCASFPPGGPYLVENQTKNEIRLEIYPSFGANIFGFLYRVDTYIVRVAPESSWDSRTSSASERVPYDERLGLAAHDWIALSINDDTNYIIIRRQRVDGRKSKLANMRVTAGNQLEFYDQDDHPIRGDRVEYRRLLGSNE
ncbi:MAG: hypothetical protein IT432_11855 [Phycisphaerales bacterium]|nr:hypothetical protein [Phycisphaerales bacterium]